MVDEQLKEATTRNVYLLQTDNDRLMEIVKKIKQLAKYEVETLDDEELIKRIDQLCDKALKLK